MKIEVKIAHFTLKFLSIKGGVQFVDFGIFYNSFLDSSILILFFVYHDRDYNVSVTRAL